MASCARVGEGRSSDFQTRDKNNGNESPSRCSMGLEGACFVVLGIRYLNGKRGGLQRRTAPSHAVLLFTSLASLTEGNGNGLFLRATFLYQLADVFGNGLFGTTFFKWHDHFILVLYRLPRQVNSLAPEVRAALNAWSKVFLLKEA